MKNITKKIINKAGYRLVNLYGSYYFIESVKNLIIEFIGPPGVGKSTILKKYIKSGSVNFHLQKMKIQSDLNKDELEHWHVKILYSKLNEILNKFSYNITEYNDIKTFIDIIQQDLYQSYLEGCILKSEGVFHHFGKTIIEFSDLYPHDFTRLLNNHAVIEISGKPETIYNQMISRYKKNGKLWIGYTGTKEESINNIQSLLDGYKKVTNRISLYNGLCLKLKIEDGVNNNVRLIDSFIKGICLK